MAEWWENLVPNLVSGVREQIEPNIAPHRNAQGRIDPTAIKAMVPSDVGESVDLVSKLGNMRLDAVNSIRPKPLNNWQWLGGALQEISVPVAYATGNSAYGQQMMPMTGLKQHRARELDYEDQANKARLGIMDESLGSVSNTALDFMKNKRLKKQAAMERAANIIATAGALEETPEGKASAKARAAQMAAEHLRLNGMPQDADTVLKMYGGQAPSPVDAPVAPMPQVPGTVVTSPMGQSMGQAVKPGAAMPQDARPQPQARMPLIQRLEDQINNARSPTDTRYRRAAADVAVLNPELAKTYEEEAKRREEVPGKIAIESGKKAAESLQKLRDDQPNAVKTLIAGTEIGKNMSNVIDKIVERDTDGNIVGLNRDASNVVGGVWDSADWNTTRQTSARAANAINELTSKLGVQALNDMRAASAGGGAVGAVSEKEWPILQSQIASLNRFTTEQDFAAQLAKIESTMKRISTSMVDVYRDTYGVDETDPRISAISQSYPGIMSQSAMGQAPQAPQPQAESRPLQAPPQIGEVRTKVINGISVPHIRTEQGWVPQGGTQLQVPGAPTTPMNRAGAMLNARRY